MSGDFGRATDPEHAGPDRENGDRAWNAANGVR